jgi:hypothetical protein
VLEVEDKVLLLLAAMVLLQFGVVLQVLVVLLVNQEVLVLVGEDTAQALAQQVLVELEHQAEAVVAAMPTEALALVVVVMEFLQVVAVVHLVEVQLVAAAAVTR